MAMLPTTQTSLALNDYIKTAWTAPKYAGLAETIRSVADGAIVVQEKLGQAALAGALGSTGGTNVQGEEVQLLDAFATDALCDALRRSGKVAAVVAEELEAVTVLNQAPSAPFVCAFDPVDGSSNIDVAVSIGSIFGFWRRSSPGEVGEGDFLKPGREQVAAAYLVYGSSTVLVIASAEGVEGFTLDGRLGRFFLTHPKIRIPDPCQYYSVNEGNFHKLEAQTQKVVENLRKTYSLRYVGSLVADFHRNLLKGGIFLYPRDTKNKDGKLRLLYEANPLSFIAEQAGGAATTGSQRILDVQPTRVHQRIPLIVGNADVVRAVETSLSASVGA